MKITYKQLKQLIKEQVSSVLFEQTGASRRRASGGSISDPAGAAMASGGFAFAPTAPGAAATSVIAPAAGAPSGGATGPSAPVRVDRPGRAGSGMAAIEPTRSSYELPAPAATTEVPPDISDAARLAVDSGQPRSLINITSRLPRLLSRNQEAAAAQALGFLARSVQATQTRLRAVIATANRTRASYAERRREVGALGYGPFNARVVNWAQSIRTIASTLQSIMPASIPPAGSPERQQLITALTNANTRLNAALNDWQSIEREFASRSSGGGTFAPSRRAPASGPAPTPPAAPGGTSGPPLVAESRRRRGKKL